MKLFLIRSTIFLFLTFLVFQGLGYFLEAQFARDYSNKLTWVRKAQSGNFDYAFLGSSRALNMVDINQIEERTGLSGINLGIGGSDYRVLYMILYTFVSKQNNSIDHLFLQIDPFSIYKDSIYSKPKMDHYFYHLSDDPEIRSCFLSQTKPTLYKYFPIGKFIEFNTVFNITHFVRSFREDDRFDRSGGSVLIEKHKPFSPKQYDGDFKNTNFSEEEYRYLGKILEFCRQNDIPVDLYTSPVYTFIENYGPRYPEYYPFLDQLQEEQGLIYYDFGSLFNNDAEYFADMVHLNASGTNRFMEEVLKTFPLFRQTSVGQ